MTKMLFLPDSRDRALPKDRNTRETISCNMKFCFLCYTNYDFRDVYKSFGT